MTYRISSELTRHVLEVARVFPPVGATSHITIAGYRSGLFVFTLVVHITEKLSLTISIILTYLQGKELIR